MTEMAAYFDYPSKNTPPSLLKKFRGLISSDPGANSPMVSLSTAPPSLKALLQNTLDGANRFRSS